MITIGYLTFFWYKPHTSTSIYLPQNIGRQYLLSLDLIPNAVTICLKFVTITQSMSIRISLWDLNIELDFQIHVSSYYEVS